VSSLFDFLPEDNGRSDDGHCPEDEGDRLRDEALDRLRRWRPRLVRRIQRTFIRHLLDHGPDTSDAVRELVPIPPGFDPRVVGGAVGGLSDVGLIRSVGRRKSRRSPAHSRHIELWAAGDPGVVVAWLTANPDLGDPTAEVAGA
jgi:hypothetical protein